MALGRCSSTHSHGVSVDGAVWQPNLALYEAVGAYNSWKGGFKWWESPLINRNGKLVRWDIPPEVQEGERWILEKDPLIRTAISAKMRWKERKHAGVYISPKLRNWRPKVWEEIPVPPDLKPTFISALGLPPDVVPFSEKPWLWALGHPHIMEHAKHKWLSGDAAEERAIRYVDRDHELLPQMQRNEALHSVREAMKQAWEEALSNLEAEGGRIVRDTVLHRVALDYRIWELRDLDVMQGEGKTWEEISQLPEWGKIPARQVQYEVDPYLEKFKQEWKRLRWRAYLQCRRQLKKKDA